MRKDHAHLPGDLLVTVIGISGVTIPLCIVYLTLGRDRELFVSVSERLPYLLELENLTPDRVRAAVLYVKSTADGALPFLQASKSLGVVYEMVRFKDRVVSGVAISAEALNKLLTPDRQKIFRNYFKNNYDREIIIYYMWIVGISAIACFTFLYCEYFEIDSPMGYRSAHFLVVFTFLANVSTYQFLIHVVHAKDRIHREAGQAAKGMCEEVAIEVRNLETFITRVENDVSERFTAQTVGPPAATVQV